MPDTLVDKVRAKYPGSYTDLSDQQLDTMVRAKFPGVYDDLAKPTPPSVRPDQHGDVLLDNLANVGRAATGVLPAVGGILGGTLGAVGGPAGAIGGAALGGAAGEAGRQLINRATGGPTPATSGAAAESIGLQGGLQGAGEGFGIGALQLAGKASPWLMSRALNLTDKLSREFPQLSQVMIDHALTVTRGGLSQARTVLRAAKAQVNAALDTAAATGATVPITAATDGLMRTVPKVMSSSDIEGGLAALAAAERKITAGRGLTLTPHEADALKASLQTESKSLYTAEKLGTGRPNVSVLAQGKADMASSLNQAIGEITTAAGHPGYRTGNADAQEMIGAVRGITKGIRPGANLYQAMVRPGVGAIVGSVVGGETGGSRGAVAGTLLGTAALSPWGMSRLAVTLSKPSVQLILRGAPQLAAAVGAYMQAMRADAAAAPTATSATTSESTPPPPPRR